MVIIPGMFNLNPRNIVIGLVVLTVGLGMAQLVHWWVTKK